jgi:hypothetical protein
MRNVFDTKTFIEEGVPSTNPKLRGPEFDRPVEC